jgi:ParB family transcriptional regulator, chromosome partitioning protein
MPKQRFGLGRGLDALIPSGSSPVNRAPSTSIPHVPDETLLDTSLSPSALYEVPCDAIAPNPQQPRGPAEEDDEQLNELASSIGRYGLLQPLLVAIVGADEEGEPVYQLIAGERRLRAALMAGLEHVPVVIREATPQQMLEMALVENLQRTDLNPLEEAQGYLMLQEEYNLTQEQIATRVGRDRSTVANTIRLLQLPEEVRAYLVTMPKVFTEGHARAVLQVVGDSERIELAKLIISQRMSVRQAEELARRYNEAAIRLTPDRRGGAGARRTVEIEALEEDFRRAVEMKVRLMRNAKGRGSLTLYFNNEDQLQILYQRLVAAQGGASGYSGFTGEDDAVSALLGESYDAS